LEWSNRSRNRGMGTTALGRSAEGFAIIGRASSRPKVGGPVSARSISKACVGSQVIQHRQRADLVAATARLAGVAAAHLVVALPPKLVDRNLV
jgi:hypothetical protein